MTVWALLGNTLYNGLDGRFFNWFFVVRDPFYILPEGIAPFIMPVVMMAVMFTGEVLIRLVYTAINRLGSPRQTSR
jgi:membrane protein insertase Oxa1/YidC/SpoIIIJ